MRKQDFERVPAAESKKTGTDFWPAAHSHNLTLIVGERISG
jgi:hypothetical protein